MTNTKYCYCEKCNKTMENDQFYQSNNLEKYPNGKLKQCKDCITKNIDINNPETYLWILQECDVPYDPCIWKKMTNRSNFQKKPTLGKYLSFMRLGSYMRFRWEDSYRFNEGDDRFGR